MTPRELYESIWTILKLRDSIVKTISYGIEKIPGLGPLIDVRFALHASTELTELNSGHH